MHLEGAKGGLNVVHVFSGPGEHARMVADRSFGFPSTFPGLLLNRVEAAWFLNETSATEALLRLTVKLSEQ